MESSSVKQLFAPDLSAMQEMLAHLFGETPAGYSDGLVELAWTDAKPPHALRHAQLFPIDRLDALAALAAEKNAVPGCNVYVGAALRKPETPPFGRSSRDDVLALTAYYVDLDEAGAVEKARAVYAHLKPSLVVVTGKEPATRAQLWWRLEEPISELDRTERTLQGLAAAMAGDPKVFDGPRVMRLAGSVAWPVKAGRVIELTAIAKLKAPGALEYMPEAIERLCAPLATPDAVTSDATVYSRGGSTIATLGQISDGRESYMRDTLLAVLVELCASDGCVPTVQELVDEAWPQYAAHVDLARTGRNRDEMVRKARYTLARFEAGRIPGLPTLEAAIAAGQAKKLAAVTPATYEAAAEAGAATESFDAPSGDVFPTYSMDDLINLPPPQWLVDGIIPERGLTFIYGQRGKGKSFVTLDMALTVAHGGRWLGRDTKGGGVLYCAGEGVAGYGVRVEGWLRRNKQAPSGNFRLMPVVPNFTTAADVEKLARTIMQVIGDARLVIIDTVARAIPGAEENSSREMGLFIAACDAIKRACNVAVTGVHHSGKDDERGMRGSSALEGAGDAIIHMKRLETGSIELHSDKMKDGEEFDPIRLDMVKEEWLDARDPLGKPRSTLVPVLVSGGAMAFPNDTATHSILRAVDLAWNQGKPFSMAPQMRVKGRHLPTWVAQQYHLKDDASKEYCEGLLYRSSAIEISSYTDENRKVRDGLRATTNTGEDA